MIDGFWFPIVQNWSARWWLWQFARIYIEEAMCLILLMAPAFGCIYLVLELPCILRGPMACPAWINWWRVHPLCPCWSAAGSPNHDLDAASFPSPILAYFTGTKFCLCLCSKMTRQNFVPVNCFAEFFTGTTFCLLFIVFYEAKFCTCRRLLQFYRYKILSTFG